MIRDLVVVFVAVSVAACGSKSAPPSTVGRATPIETPDASVADAAVEQTALDELEGEAQKPCEPWVKQWPAGNHDRYVFEDATTERYGYKTKAGDIVIPARFREAYPFWPGGFAAVIVAPSKDVDEKNPLRWIDPTGKIIATAGHDYFVDGFFRVVDAKGKLGFMNDKGVVVIQPQYDFAWQFCNGAAKIEHGGKTFWIDATNKRVKDPGPPPERQ